MTARRCEDIPAISNSLRDATHAHRLAGMSRVATAIGACAGLLGLLLVLAVKSVFSTGELVTSVMASLPLLAIILSAIGWAKSQRLAKTRDANLDNAYALAIVELLSQGSSAATSGQLAAALRIEPRRAEGLLASLNVRDDIESEVTDDGQLVYLARGNSRNMRFDQSVQPVTERLRVPDASAGAEDGISDPNQDGSTVKTQVSSVAKT